MFKAIGRWGSQVKSRIRIPFISGLFGSKSTSYAGMDDEEEEIFSDAKEELEDVSDSDDDPKVLVTVADCTVPAATKVAAGNGQSVTVKSDPATPGGSRKASDRTETDSGTTCVHAEVTTSRGSEERLADVPEHKADDDGSSQSEDSDQEGEQEHSGDEHNTHHDAHSDKKKIIRTENKTNGVTKSPSTSTFKKVHRRISSFTQKQYSKLDNNANDDVDNLVQHESDNHVTDSAEITEDVRSEKKPSRRKKVPVFDFFRNIFRFTNRQSRTRMN